MKLPMPHVEGVEHKYVFVNGVNLHFAESGGGEPVIMLHGWPQHWYMWRHQIPRLADKFRVICPDMRGFGWSDAPDHGYEKENLVDDVLALADALEIKRFRLVGHDWGGWVGFLLALREPERVRSFLALNITHPFQKPDMRLLQLWRLWYQVVIAFPGLGEWLIRETDVVARSLQRNFVYTPMTEEEAAIYADSLRDPERARASALMYRTFLLEEFLPMVSGKYRSERLKVRTRLLFGVEDFAISTAFLRGFEHYTDDMTIEFIEDCGHFIAEDRPELVTVRALDFFTS